MVKLAKTVKQRGKPEGVSEARKRLKSVFEAIRFVELQGIRTGVRIGDGEADLVFSALILGKPVKFVVEVKSQAEPRFIRFAVERLKRFVQGKKDFYGIIVAPYLSDASRQLCEEGEVGCVDLAGNAFISFRTIFIDKSGVPNPLAATRVARSLFSPKSGRILRVLLSDPSKKWFVQDISKEAGVSIGLASRIKQALLAEEWVREENKRFSLGKPGEALREWSENYSYTKNRSFSFYSGLSQDQFDEAIKIECARRKWIYGLGLFSGARRVAPFVRFMRFFAYIDGDILALAKSLDFKQVETGANVTLLEPYDEGVFYGLQNIGGVSVVSDIQLYLDLKSYKGRGDEAAQTVFEQRIKPRW